MEPRLAEFRPGDAATYRLLSDALVPAAAPLNDLTLSIAFAESRYVDRARARPDHRVIVASLAGIAIAGVLLVFLLLREQRAARAALGAAQAAQANEASAHRRLLDAVGAFPGGFAVYDPADRLVLCNEGYRSVDPRASRFILPDATFTAIIRSLAELGLVVEARGREEEWLAERLNNRRVTKNTAEYQLADGRWIRVHERRTGDGGRVLLAIDITAAKEHEAALARLADRNDQFAATIAALPLGVVIGDAAKPGYPLVFVNQAFCAMSGYGEDELIGRASAMLRGPETDAAALAKLRRVLSERTPGQVDLLNYRKDGTPWWNRVCVAPVRDERGEVRYMVGVNTDITASRRAEQALRESEQRFRSLAESVAAAIVIWDQAGRIQFWNPGAERTFGYAAQTVAGRSVAMLVPARYRDRGDDAAPSACTQGGPGAKRMDGLRADGSEFPLECALTSWQGAGGWLFAAFIQDISARLNAERERDDLAQQFHQAQKMEAVGTLAGGVAHDFNNILAIMLGHAELLQMDLARESAAAASLGEILTAGRRATELVRQLLTFSRQYGREVAPVSLAEIARETHGLLRATLPASIELALRESFASAVLADATQMHQVIVNLCVNAQHAIGGVPGRIEVAVEDVTVADGPTLPPLASAEAGRRPARVLLGGLVPGPYVRLLVVDSGRGMDERTLTRAFEPFFTTRAHGQGSGLGLAAVRGIALAHDGAVVVESLVGVGTWVAIYLPRHGGEVVAVTREAAVPETGQGRILLIDDEEAIVRVGAETLRRLGYTVDVATDPVAALEVFRSRPGDWDLVVTDQTMPRLAGVALAGEMLRLRPRLPIVLCAGYSGAVNAEEAQVSGIAEFLMKPVRARDLAAAVKRALARVQGEREQTEEDEHGARAAD